MRSENGFWPCKYLLSMRGNTTNTGESNRLSIVKTSRDTPSSMSLRRMMFSVAEPIRIVTRTNTNFRMDALQIKVHRHL